MLLFVYLQIPTPVQGKYALLCSFCFPFSPLLFFRTYPFYGTSPRIDIFIKNPNLIHLMLCIREGVEVSSLNKEYCTANFIFKDIKTRAIYKGETKEEIQKLIDFLCGRGLFTIKKDGIKYYGSDLLHTYLTDKVNINEYRFLCTEDDTITTS